MLKPSDWAEIPGLVAAFGGRGELPPSGTALVRQVHGSDFAHRKDLAEGENATEADAVIAEAKSRDGSVGAVKTADCVPILLVDPAMGWAAAVHAGWRGTRAEIAARVVAEHRRKTERQSADLRAALGPSIGPCCYEVSTELVREFNDAGLRDPSNQQGTYLDLRAANRTILRRAGLLDENIQDVGPCTKCNPAEYYSYRGDASEKGRQLSWAGWVDRADQKLHEDR